MSDKQRMLNIVRVRVRTNIRLRSPCKKGFGHIFHPAIACRIDLDVSRFGFVEGIEILRVVAGLKVISPIVTLQFNLLFEPLQNY